MVAQMVEFTYMVGDKSLMWITCCTCYLCNSFLWLFLA